MDLRLFIFNFSREKAFIAIVCFIVAVIIIEMLCAAFLPGSSMVVAFNSIRTKTETVQAPDFQIVGDSVARDGIWACELMERIPNSANFRNDCLRGSGPVFTYFLIRKAINRGNIPKTIIFAHSPHTFSGVRFPILVGRFCYWGEIVELLLSRYKPFDIMYGILAKVFYTICYRDEFKKSLKGDLEFFTTQHMQLLSEEGRIKEAEKKGDLDEHKDILPDEVNKMYYEHFSVSRINEIYLDKLLALADKNNIRIAWVTMPVTEKVFQIREKNGFNRDYYEFLTRLQQKYAITFLQKEFIVYPNKDFRDYSHLKIAAGLRFTITLARNLMQGEIVT